MEELWYLSSSVYPIQIYSYIIKNISKPLKIKEYWNNVLQHNMVYRFMASEIGCCKPAERHNIMIVTDKCKEAILIVEWAFSILRSIPHNYDYCDLRFLDKAKNILSTYMFFVHEWIVNQNLPFSWAWAPMDYYILAALFILLPFPSLAQFDQNRSQVTANDMANWVNIQVTMTVPFVNVVLFI